MIKYQLTIKQPPVEISKTFEADNGIPAALWAFCDDAVDPEKDAELHVIRIDR